MQNPPLYHLELRGVPIYEQLQMEEALLRCSEENILVTNCAAPSAIVLGISNVFSSLVNLEHYRKKPLPVVKRYSGGGTVVVDSSTCFVSFLCNQKDTCPGQVEQIHTFMYALYASVFFPHPFSLKENDYVLGERKFAGNAQYVTKNRWVHHTTFLWDFSEELMAYLQLPQKRPRYRLDRSHKDFLTTMQSAFTNREEFFYKLYTEVQNVFSLRKLPIEEVQELMRSREYRKATTLVHAMA